MDVAFPLFGIVFFRVLFVLLAAAVGLVAYLIIPGIVQRVRHDSALVTLEQRFARGEIDSEEFKKRRQDLLTR